MKSHGLTCLLCNVADCLRLARRVFHWVLLSILALTVQAKAASAVLTGDPVATSQGDLVIHPIHHATLALGWNGQTLYVDPVGGAQRFADLPKPDLILVTDIHGDHLNAETLESVTGDKTTIIAPSAVVKELPSALRSRAKPLDAGQQTTLGGIEILAMPAYNLAPERQKFHAKGRGVGYVLGLGGKRVYLSGDTEDIPEMRALKGIDVAFLCMNLPYTMTVEQAAGAVREFRPGIVYPYHSRGSDLEKFKKLVGDDAGVEVRIRDWYKP